MGNGYLSHAKGVRSDTMFVSGIFNGETTSPSHRANIPAALAITVQNTTSIGVLLDIETGTYHRRGYLTAEQTSWYELRWYAHRNLRSLYVMELEVHLENESSATLHFNSNENMSSVDIKFDPAKTLNGHAAYSMCGQTITPEVSTGPTPTVCMAFDRVTSEFVVNKEDSGKVFTYVTAIRTSLDSSDVESAAIADYKSAHYKASAATLYSDHVDGWKSLWNSGIEIAGRPDVGAAINASMYAILSSVRDDWAYGLAPGGLTNYYNGHSFWDTETWMYPPLLFLQPKISRSLVQYRFDRLDGARAKAASYSPPWAGTMFPWESAFSGAETCPSWAATGSREDHISGDIALAVWQEWNMRKDKQWLQTIGYPILSGVADFWVSRSVYEVDEDNVTRAHIKNIIPPDEYVDHVTDSVYSNFVASQALNFAVKASSILGVECSSCATYSKLAGDLVILFDTEKGIHPEYLHYPGNKVKQADVVLLHYPLGMEMDEDIQRADLEYYSSRTDPHGPAMTWGMHSIGYLDLDDYNNANKFFNMSFQDNMHAPLQVWTETPDGNAVNFITGAGGFLQTMIFGYPGFRITENGLIYQPRCPEGATSIKMKNLAYLGSTFFTYYNCANNEATTVHLEAKELGDVSLSLQVVSMDHKKVLSTLVTKLEVGRSVELNLAQLRKEFGRFKLILAH